MTDLHDSDVVLRFSLVSFSYDSAPVLENADFHVHRGEFVALVGPNGAGKTTVLKLILGLERPASGAIELFGEPAPRERNRIGYVPQHASYDPTFPVSVREVVKMGRLHPHSRKFETDDERAVDEALARAEVSDLASRPYPALSGGQRRRVLVARALASKPELLILDEPTANMDAESEARLFATLERLKGNTTIMIVTHDTGFVSALTDSVLCVGDRSTKGGAYSVARHGTEPSGDAPPELFGGKASKVLHGVDLGNGCSCGRGDTK